MNDILQHNDHYTNVRFSAEDKVLYGKFISNSDLILFEADSVKDLKEVFVEAVEDYLDT